MLWNDGVRVEDEEYGATMSRGFLTAAERDRLGRFPADIPDEDRIAHFTLFARDREKIGRLRGAHNQLGFASQLCALRYLGFVPDELTTAPHEIINFVANQLDLEPESLSAYGKRVRTRQKHFQAVMNHLRFRKASLVEFSVLQLWLLERALEHARPSFLLSLACEKLHADRVVRPGITTLEGHVVRAREAAWRETYQRLEPLLDEQRKKLLDRLLVPEPSIGMTRLSWLRKGATSDSAGQILAAIRKITLLRRLGVDRWDLSVLNPNRLKFLAQIGRTATNQYLQRRSDERRFPILVSFLKQSLIDITVTFGIKWQRSGIKWQCAMRPYLSHLTNIPSRSR